MELFGASELKKNVIEAGLCIGCGACINLCPYFQSHRGKTAALFPCDKDKGRCFAYCPKIEVDPDELSKFLFQEHYNCSPLGFWRSIHISRAGAKVKKQAFQSGGSVSALVYFALRSKRIRGAILTGRDGLLPVSSLVTRPAEVLRRSLSKYTAAPTLSALNQAIEYKKGALGVVATPCQATAVAQMRRNPLDDPLFEDQIGLVMGFSAPGPWISVGSRPFCHREYPCLR